MYLTVTFPGGKQKRLKEKLAKHLESRGKVVLDNVYLTRDLKAETDPVTLNQPEIAGAAEELAKENNVDIGEVKGTGKDGKILKRDVQTYLTRALRAE